jgi:tRNA nucleotidyltransferase/poly(A) polymerase
MLTIRAKFPSNQKYSKELNMTADFVLARKEVYLDNLSRIPTVELGSLEDDLMRRYFTINALAMDMSGKIIDITNGLEDIKSKILRTPLDPYITLNDDPLRVLRALRFSITKKFTLDEQLLQAIKNPTIIEKLVNIISKERIREELNKMFSYSTPDTLRLLYQIDSVVPCFIDSLFGTNIKLIPTIKIK